MKKCKICLESKSIKDFYKRSPNSSKLRPYCKKCWYEYNHKYNSYEYAKRYRKSLKDRYGLGLNTIYRFGLELALLIYDRAERRCEICKSLNDLTIHHIDGNGRHNIDRGLTQNNNPNNLQILCRRCHGSIEGKKGKGIKKTKNKRKEGQK